jgi:hypothetical protein
VALPDYKKCSRCKEILGLDEFPCGGKHGWCRMCSAESARRYRKTQRYRKTIAEYRARPEVQEARRQRYRLKPPPLRVCRSTPRNKLIQQRCQARYRARRYESDGKDEAAKRQWERVAMITRELAKLNATAAIIYPITIKKKRKAAE